jgi:hypothetical protein
MILGGRPGFGKMSVVSFVGNEQRTYSVIQFLTE